MFSNKVYSVLFEVFDSNGNSEFEHCFIECLGGIDEVYHLFLVSCSNDYPESDILLHEIRLCERR